MDQVYSLFPTPFLRSYLEVTPSVREFVQYLDYNQAEYGNVSQNKDILNYPHMREYKDKIIGKLCDYFYDVCGMSQSSVPVITTSWVNLHHPGDYNETHIHYNSVLSGVWYLSVTKNSGDFSFMREGKELFGNTFSFTPENLNDFNTQSAAFVPQIGDLFIFPSSLKHRVEKNLEQFDRLSLAFNCLVKGTAQSEGVEVII